MSAVHLFLGLLLAVLCTMPTHAHTTDLPNYDDVMAITLRHIEAENSHNTSRILDTLTPDCTFKFEFMPFKTWRGHSGATSFYDFLFGLIPDFHVTLEEFVLGEEGAAVMTAFTGWDIKTHSVLHGKFSTVQLFDRPTKLSAGEKFFLFWKNAEKEANSTTHSIALRTARTPSKDAQLRLRPTSVSVEDKRAVQRAWREVLDDVAGQAQAQAQADTHTQAPTQGQAPLCPAAPLHVISGVATVATADSRAGAFLALVRAGGRVGVSYELVGTEAVFFAGELRIPAQSAVEFVAVTMFDHARGCFDAVRLHVHSGDVHDAASLHIGE
eukprot:CAMPEP_0177685364 /NCGR_PEP_ID=MMETSP0447-20121125/32992_1 /TAXON_ID=0 /ORGANISM="Stygamoeba regulata, Strain BSH-02190019" /LENGTH=325 /DNA_ID=CAMNT_0019195407 /DNA_START=78 /DNA_END=1055 /DNA_ORIENTATION=-